MQEKNAMKPTHDALLERFRQAFPEAVIQVEDESHLHVGHAGAAGGAGHFRVRVIDARFNGLQRIARHRLVYDAVSDWMPAQVHARVHALNIIAMTLEEAGHASTIQQGAILIAHSSVGLQWLMGQSRTGNRLDKARELCESKGHAESDRKKFFTSINHERKRTDVRTTIYRSGLAPISIQFGGGSR
jgi:BolA protein